MNAGTVSNMETPKASERVRIRVKWEREAAGLSLAQLASRLESIGHPIGANSLWKIEQGARQVSVDDLEALARALSVSPGVLLGSGGDDMPMSEVREIERLAGELEPTLSALRRSVERVAGRMRALDVTGEDLAERFGDEALVGTPPRAEDVLPGPRATLDVERLIRDAGPIWDSEPAVQAITAELERLRGLLVELADAVAGHCYFDHGGSSCIRVFEIVDRAQRGLT